MEKILEYGGAPVCSPEQETAFKAQLKKVSDIFYDPTSDPTAVKEAMRLLGNVTFDFEGSKPPGFFQKVHSTCSISGTKFFKDQSAPDAPSRINAAQARAGALPPFILPVPRLEISDAMSISQGTLKPDFVRIGLCAAVLLLLLIVLIQLMRGSGRRN